LKIGDKITVNTQAKVTDVTQCRLK